MSKKKKDNSKDEIQVNEKIRERAKEREEYWYQQTTEELNEKVKKYYQQSLSEIERDIAALYGRYAGENGLTRAEARRLIRGEEFRIWRKTLQEYVEEAKNDSAILLELNTLAMRSRINRLEALHGRTLLEIAKLCEKLEKTEDALEYRAYLAHYYGNMYDIHKAFGLYTAPVVVEAKQVENVLRSPWSGKNYSTRIWTNGQKLTQELKELVEQGVHRGRSIKNLSKDLSKRMNVSYNNAERLIRTEMSFVQNKANADSIRDSGMEYYQFVATLDNRTTPTCQSLDGKVLPLDEFEQGLNAPPMHVRCRSTICAADGENLPVRKKARTSKVNGERVKVPGYLSYDDWKAIYIDKTKSLKDYKSEKAKGLYIWSKIYLVAENTLPHKIGELADVTPENADKALKHFEDKILTAPIENAMIITQQGEIYHCTGDLNTLGSVDHSGKKLEGAFVTHNHPENSANEYSFSEQDIRLFIDFKLAKLRGIDEKFVYEFNRNDKIVDGKGYTIQDIIDNEGDYLAKHSVVADKAVENQIGYRRWKR